MGLPKRSTEHFNYGDYAGWSDDQRWELIDGQAYAMSPAPSVAHQETAGRIYRQIADALEGTPCRVLLAPIDVRLPKQAEADDAVDTVVQPDLLVVCDPQKVDAKGIRGAPDWIVEVLSPRTASHDQIVKRDLYERAGVPEYWLVHPIDHVLIIYRLDETGRYGRPDVFETIGETACLTMPKVLIDWSRVIDPATPID